MRRALLSVYDKSGIVELAAALHARDIELISTGGTAKVLQEAGLPVTQVQELTQFPEGFGGRVKTLHPAIHAGLLARPELEEDARALASFGYAGIQLLVVNLYPFQDVIKDGPALETAVENIDIGGPAMLRAASKNMDSVCALSAPAQYDAFLKELEAEGGVSFTFRMQAALAGFQHTAAYDTGIAAYLSYKARSGFPDTLNLQLPKYSGLRYGENPHQAAAVYGNQQDYVEILHGKQLSYNNLLDVDAALNIIQDYSDNAPSCAIVKHTLPCGIATRETLPEAWQAAFATDTQSPFGGIIAVNRPLDAQTAAAIDEIFTEIILAPDFEPEALELLQKKSNRRLVKIKHLESLYEDGYVYRSVFGGLLCQQPDVAPPDVKNFQIVTKKRPTEAQMHDMQFAWKVVKRVNSNAIVFAKNMQTIGIGSGQPSRIDASEFAVAKAQKFGHTLEGSVLASDAFFPFRDGIDAAARAGAKAIIQPGGSIRDHECIEAANEHGISMIFTSRRHFKH
ncbi:MAG: bifunctional phosphoribosylaminoimidazolecarboxamide formyltransferase/IMP cyclohydrolase [Cyclonatronaceae bacterium]